MKTERISVKQLRALFFAGVLSPAVRLIPNSTVRLAESASWLSPLAALMPILLYCLLLAGALSAHREGSGLRETVFLAVGKPAGAVLLFAAGVWLSLYAGFLLRVNAERLHATIFKEERVLFFAAAGLVLVVIAARGGVKTLARMAEVCLPLLLAVFALCGILAMADVKPKYMLPVTASDLGGAALGALPILNVFAISSYYLLFLGETEKTPGTRQLLLRGGLWSAAGAMTVVVSVVGTLSAPLADHLNNPFFVMTRNLSVLGRNERVEAVVIAVWVISDLIFAASVLRASAAALQALRGKGDAGTFVWPAAAGALAGAVFCAGDAFVLSRVSEYFVPMINLFFTCILFPAVFLAAAARKRRRRKKGGSTTSWGK